MTYILDGTSHKSDSQIKQVNIFCADKWTLHGLLNGGVRTAHKQWPWHGYHEGTKQ